MGTVTGTNRNWNESVIGNGNENGSRNDNGRENGNGDGN